MSTERIYDAVLNVTSRRLANGTVSTHLDVGAGNGQLVKLFRDRFQVQSSACDYTDQLMKLPGQKVDIVNLNTERFPYPDATFDIVTATEVVEHLERYREVLRDLFRVTKPGGLVILTTPNILNLNSRLRFLWFGYWNLFGPLPVRNSALYSTGGHINPCSYFYLAHALMDAGFDGVELDIDKPQRSAVAKLVLLYPFIKLFGALAYQREENHYRTISPENAPLVQAMNSTPMLLGRTIVVSAVKPRLIGKS
jgi:ubiquinone/menaquinone biosynthesis C-methylase UbiE